MKLFLFRYLFLCCFAAAASALALDTVMIDANGNVLPPRDPSKHTNLPAGSTLNGNPIAAFPSLSGNSGKFLTNNGSAVSWGTVTAPTWGSITGTLSSQTDLNTALAGKASLTGGTSGHVITATGATTIGDSGTALSSLAPKASPTFTGTVTIPDGGALGTPASLTLTNATGLPQSGVTNLVSDLAAKLSSVPVGNTLYVDAVNGNDSTGTRGRQDKPYLTLAAARTAASSGDTVIVLPGAYSITDSVLKNGVAWRLHPNVTVTYTNSATDYGPLDDKGVAITCTVSGGTWIRNEPSGTFTNPAIVSSTNAASNIAIDVESITFSGAFTGNSYVAWNQAAGTLYVRARRLTNSTSSTAYGIGWLNGQTTIQASIITSTLHGVLSAVSVTPTGFLYVDADEITAAGNAVWCNTGSDTSAAAWIRTAVLRSTGSTLHNAVRTDAGGNNKIYVNAQKIFGSVRNDGAGLTYVDTEKWEPLYNGSLSAGLFLTVSDGTVWVEAKHADALSYTTSTAGAWKVSGGTVNLRVLSYVSGASSGGFAIQGGTTWVTESRVDTSANSGRNTVDVSGGTVTLQNCNLTSNAAKVDIAQTGGTANIVNGRGTNADGTFTTSGTVSFVSNNLRKAANLSDLTSASTARDNLGASSGIWPGSLGGTGVANTGKTITLGGNLTTSGAFATTLTVTGATSLTLPTSGTVLSDASTISGSQISGGTMGAVNLSAGTNLNASNLASGTVPIGRLPTGTGSSNVPVGGVITAGGPTGSSTAVPVITYNAAGQLTAVSTAAITQPPSGPKPVQSATQNGSTLTNSLALTLGSAPTNGNLLLLISGHESSGTISSVTQTGVTWTKIVGSTGAPVCEIWKGVVGSGAGTGITVAYSDSNYSQYVVSEWSGIAGTTDVTATTDSIAGSSGYPRTPLILPTRTSALVVAGVLASNNSANYNQNGTGNLLSFSATSSNTMRILTGYGFPGTVPSQVVSMAANAGTFGGAAVSLY